MQSTLISFDFGSAGDVPQNWNPVALVGVFTGPVDKAGDAMSIAVENPDNLNVLDGGVHLGGMVLRECDGSRPFHAVPVMPRVGLLALRGSLGLTASRQRNLLR